MKLGIEMIKWFTASAGWLAQLRLNTLQELQYRVSLCLLHFQCELPPDPLVFRAP